MFAIMVMNVYGGIWIYGRRRHTCMRRCHGLIVQSTVLSVSVPWAKPLSRFSMAFEVRVILALKLTKVVEGAHTIMQILWGEARSIMERAVASDGHAPQAMQRLRPRH